jgi:hypothetical protein
VGWWKLRLQKKKEVLLGKRLDLLGRNGVLIGKMESSSSGDEKEVRLEKVRLIEQEKKREWLREKLEDRRRGKVEREEVRKKCELKRRLSLQHRQEEGLKKKKEMIEEEIGALWARREMQRIQEQNEIEARQKLRIQIALEQEEQQNEIEMLQRQQETQDLHVTN